MISNFVEIINGINYRYILCSMLGQSRRRWGDVVQMLCKCFVFAGIVNCEKFVLQNFLDWYFRITLYLFNYSALKAFMHVIII